MMTELVEYSASLSLPHLSPEQMRTIEGAAQEVGLEVDLSLSWLGFEYSGRDHNRKIVGFLVRIAPLIGDSPGEVECRLVNDGGDDTFEFYTIRRSRLLRQSAQIVRQTPQPVYDLEAIKANAAEFTAEDLALAESDLAHRAALLAAEDAA